MKHLEGQVQQLLAAAAVSQAQSAVDAAFWHNRCPSGCTGQISTGLRLSRAWVNDELSQLAGGKLPGSNLAASHDKDSESTDPSTTSTLSELEEFIGDLKQQPIMQRTQWLQTLSFLDSLQLPDEDVDHFMSFMFIPVVPALVRFDGSLVEDKTASAVHRLQQRLELLKSSNSPEAVIVSKLLEVNGFKSLQQASRSHQISSMQLYLLIQWSLQGGRPSKLPSQLGNAVFHWTGAALRATIHAERTGMFQEGMAPEPQPLAMQDRLALLRLGGIYDDDSLPREHQHQQPHKQHAYDGSAEQEAPAQEQAVPAEAAVEVATSTPAPSQQSTPAAQATATQTATPTAPSAPLPLRARLGAGAGAATGLHSLPFDLPLAVEVVQEQLVELLSTARNLQAYLNSDAGVQAAASGSMASVAQLTAMGSPAALAVLAGKPHEHSVFTPTGQLKLGLEESVFGYFDAAFHAAGLTKQQHLHAALAARDVARQRMLDMGIAVAQQCPAMFDPPQVPSATLQRWGPQWNSPLSQTRSKGGFLTPLAAPMPRHSKPIAADAMQLLGLAPMSAASAAHSVQVASGDVPLGGQGLPAAKLYRGRLLSMKRPPLQAQTERCAAVSAPASLHDLPGDAPVSFARQEAVRRAFQHAWHGYAAFALGSDVLKPVSRTGEKDGDGLCKMGMTVIDAMDTAVVMGLPDIVQSTLDWVETHLTVNGQANINLFETTIRVVGGLLSAYALTGRDMLLQRASMVATALLQSGAFDTEYSIPKGTVTLANEPFSADDHRRKGSSMNPSWLKGRSAISEVLTLQLEFEFLSRATGDERFAAAADQALAHVHWLTYGGVQQQHVAAKIKPEDLPWAIPKTLGLLNIYIDPTSGQFDSGSPITLGARGDSAYEYFLKMWLSRGKVGDSAAVSNTTALSEAMAAGSELLGDVVLAAAAAAIPEQADLSPTAAAPSKHAQEALQALAFTTGDDAGQSGPVSHRTPPPEPTAAELASVLALDMHHTSLHGILSRLLRSSRNSKLSFFGEVTLGDGYRAVQTSTDKKTKLQTHRAVNAPPQFMTKIRSKADTALLQDDGGIPGEAGTGDVMLQLLRHFSEIAEVLGANGADGGDAATQQFADKLSSARLAATRARPAASGKMDHLVCFMPGVLALSAAHGVGVNTTLWGVHSLQRIAQAAETAVWSAMPSLLDTAESGQAGHRKVPTTQWLLPSADLVPHLRKHLPQDAPPDLDAKQVALLLRAARALQRYVAPLTKQLLQAHMQLVRAGGAPAASQDLNAQRVAAARGSTALSRAASSALSADEVLELHILYLHTLRVHSEADSFLVEQPSPDDALQAVLAIAAEITRSCMAMYTQAATGLGPEIATFEVGSGAPASAHHVLKQLDARWRPEASRHAERALRASSAFVSADGGTSLSGDPQKMQHASQRGGGHSAQQRGRMALPQALQDAVMQATRERFIAMASPPASGDVHINADAAHSLLRPETAESLFVLWRVTHDPLYREWGWRIFQAIQIHARVVWGGYTSVKNVNRALPGGQIMSWLSWQVPELVQSLQAHATNGSLGLHRIPEGAHLSRVSRDALRTQAQNKPMFRAVGSRVNVHGAQLAEGLTVPDSAPRDTVPTQERSNLRDSMESFFLAETLKYLYLLFSDEHVLPLDEWVFNTEAHPLPVRGSPLDVQS